MSAPTWGALDEQTGDLLDLLSEEHPAIPEEDRQWEHFKKVLAEVAKATGYIDQNAVRPLIHGEIKPQRIGALYRRARKEGLIRPVENQWTRTDYSEHGNTGRPAPVYRWLGATS